MGSTPGTEDMFSLIHFTANGLPFFFKFFTVPLLNVQVCVQMCFIAEEWMVWKEEAVCHSSACEQTAEQKYSQLMRSAAHTHSSSLSLCFLIPSILLSVCNLTTLM